MTPPHRTAPGGWAGERPVEPDRAEPTDGRHAFDRDAALTPIFTALRRGGRRRPRPGAPPLRLAPEPVERWQADPPTSPIPVVPALHALDPYPSGGYGEYPVAPADPYATGGDRYPADGVADAHVPSGHYAAAPPPSRTETTTVWPRLDGPMSHVPMSHGPMSHGPMVPTPVTDTGRHHRRLAPAGW